MDSGWVPPDTNVEEFEFAIRTVCEPILKTAGGDFLWSCAVEFVQHCAPLQYGSPASTGIATEDAAVR